MAKDAMCYWNAMAFLLSLFVNCNMFFLVDCLDLFSAICRYIKKKKKKVVQETDLVHFKVKEEIVPGPHGPKAVKLEIEDDVPVDEVIKKNEHFGAGLHAKSSAERDNPRQMRSFFGFRPSPSSD
ncbi:hypothetical protein CUMW_047610 [Citrus unshiu]|nr:hypothetical protein CUMW_047610 [Citrus unshiu]